MWHIAFEFESPRLKGCAVKLYGTVMDIVLKLSVAVPDRPWSVNRVGTALLPPPTALLPLPAVPAGLPQETNPATRTRTSTNIATPLAASGGPPSSRL